MICVGVAFYKEDTKVVERFCKNLRQVLNSTPNQIVREVFFIINSDDQRLIHQLEFFLVELNRSGQKTKLICNTENSIGGARKMTVEHSTADWVYFTDPDVLLPKNVLVDLWGEANAIENKFCLGITGQVLHRGNARLVNRTFRLLEKMGSFFSFNFQGTAQAVGSRVDHAPTAHFLINRVAALRIGNFSLQFKRVGEDLDLTHRATQKSHWIHFGGTTVIHDQNLSSVGIFGKFFDYGRAQARVFFVNGYCPQRIYRLIAALGFCFAIIFLLASPLLLLKTLSFFLILLLAFWPSIVLMILITLVYGLGTIYETIFGKLHRNK